MRFNNLELKLSRRIEKEIQDEYIRQIEILKLREDFSKELEYFLEVLSLPVFPENFKKRFNSPLAGLYCIQVPLELFDVMGFQPLRLCGASLAVQRLSSGSLPALTCPLIKSCIGGFYLEQSLEKLCDIIIVPTTCDWNSKLPELIPDKTKPLHIMELPHIQESERGQRRWLQEIYELKRFLRSHSRRDFTRKQLLVSINKYMDAWEVFRELIELRRKGGVCGIWSIIIANAFMLDNLESWTEKVKFFLENYKNPGRNDKPSVFLAGSPVFFPSLKICELIEEAGMNISADELCSSERIITGVVYDEPSEYGLFKALADRYYLGCSCPTYTDNQRRMNNIFSTMRGNNIKGVIYHLLKGCHPYDIESFHFERMAKENGFHFLKIETDYSREDKENILARLEAFRETLR